MMASKISTMQITMTSSKWCRDHIFKRSNTCSTLLKCSFIRSKIAALSKKILFVEYESKLFVTALFQAVNEKMWWITSMDSRVCTYACPIVHPKTQMQYTLATISFRETVSSFFFKFTVWRPDLLPQNNFYITRKLFSCSFEWAVDCRVSLIFWEESGLEINMNRFHFEEQKSKSFSWPIFCFSPERCRTFWRIKSLIIVPVLKNLLTF
jgi:hypothetical protein